MLIERKKIPHPKKQKQNLNRTQVYSKVQFVPIPACNRRLSASRNIQSNCLWLLLQFICLLLNFFIRSILLNLSRVNRIPSAPYCRALHFCSWCSRLRVPLTDCKLTEFCQRIWLASWWILSVWMNTRYQHLALLNLFYVRYIYTC